MVACHESMRCDGDELLNDLEETRFENIPECINVIGFFVVFNDFVGFLDFFTDLLPVCLPVDWNFPLLLVIFSGWNIKFCKYSIMVVNSRYHFQTVQECWVVYHDQVQSIFKSRRLISDLDEPMICYNRQELFMYWKIWHLRGGYVI